LCFQIRLLFNRKNKTLRAGLLTKSVMKLLEENRSTALSLRQGANQQQHPSSASSSNADDKDVAMTEDESLRPVQEVVEEILGQERWAGQRASKLDLDDFLQLLADFNGAGIHFR
jgi:18S rRNA (adenine1779-N6/adenine1780-N6)-dimethyltransferase